MHHYDLTGRRAVITGGAEGFGRAMAERFLASGAQVSLWDRNEPLLAVTAGDLSARGTVHHAVVDIAKYDQVEAAVAATVKAYGGIDILVANAARRLDSQDLGISDR